MVYKSEVRVCVVGAGIIGVPTALSILERVPGVTVTLISDAFSPDTTGDGSAGIWEPFLVDGTPEHLLKKWGQETFSHLCRIAHSCEAREAGTSLIGGYKVFNYRPPDLPLPYWRDTVLGFREMTPCEIDLFPENITYGWAYTSATCECPRYLPWLTNRFRRIGGLVEKRQIQRLDELAGAYDVIVNCTGMGSRDCTPDPEVTPLRGQVMRVRAPWIKMFVWMPHQDRYMLVNEDAVVLGGTHDEGQWECSPDPAVTRRIWRDCVNILPQLKDAEHFGDWVGLRPQRRGGIRLEPETRHTPNGTVEVVHNYGHGGAGVTLHWGCAVQAAALCGEAVHRVRANRPTIGSKL